MVIQTLLLKDVKPMQKKIIDVKHLRNIFLASLIYFLVASFYSPLAIARSGCCSWHGGVSGCDTSVGRQVCNDGTYSPSCTCIYVCFPLPDVPKNASWVFTQNNNCNQDVDITWDKTQNSSYFSVSLAKSAGINPGPNSDTSTNNYRFTDIESGSWYLNLKSGNKCGWSKVYYWKIDIPKPQSQLSVEIDSKKKLFNFSSQCIKSLKIEPEFGKVDNLKSGSFQIATDSATTYNAIALGFDGKELRRSVQYEPLVAEQEQEKSISSNNSDKNGLITVGGLGILGVVFWRAIKQKWPFNSKIKLS